MTGIEAVRLDDETIGMLTRQGLEAVRTGELSSVVGQIFPLERAADAHAVIQSRTAFGTTLLRTATKQGDRLSSASMTLIKIRRRFVVSAGVGLPDSARCERWPRGTLQRC